MGAGTTVTREQIEAMPSINRNIQDFVRLDPRVAQTDKARSEISVGGQNPRYNSITIDGVSSHDTFGLEGNSLPTPRQPFSMDAIDEIAVDVANYDVTISGGTGGVINAVTKSGTNEFHGSVYGIYRDNDWSGKNQNDIRLRRCSTDEQTYGVTFGGPLVKDKLFFFVNYEKLRPARACHRQLGLRSARLGREQHRRHHPGARSTSVIALSQAKGFDPGTLAKPLAGHRERGVRHQARLEHHRRPARQLPLRQDRAEHAVPAGLRATTSLALNTYHYVHDFKLETYVAQLFSDWTDNFSTEAKVSYRDYSAVRNPLADLPAIADPHRQQHAELRYRREHPRQRPGHRDLERFFAGNLFLGDHTSSSAPTTSRNEIYNLFAAA